MKMATAVKTELLPNVHFSNVCLCICMLARYVYMLNKKLKALNVV